MFVLYLSSFHFAVVGLNGIKRFRQNKKPKFVLFEQFCIHTGIRELQADKISILAKNMASTILFLLHKNNKGNRIILFNVLYI